MYTIVYDWRIRVSIPVTHACKACALPIELIPHKYITLVYKHIHSTCDIQYKRHHILNLVYS